MVTDNVTDLIYEAAAIPDLWPAVLERLAQVAECDKAVFFSVDETGIPRWMTNEACREAMDVFIGERWFERNTQGPRTIALGEPRFITDFDIFTADEIEEDPYYAGFLRPYGLAWGTGTYITSPGNNIMVSIHRPLEAGPVPPGHADKLTLLRPDLARATLLSARLRLEQTKANLQALEALGLPAAALSSRGRVKLATSSFEALVPEVFLVAQERLKIVEPGADECLAGALGTAAAGLPGGASFAVKRRRGEPPLLLHLIPVKGAAQDVFSQVSHLLVAVPVQGSPNPEEKLLQGLFDLTAAEARLAKVISAGLSLDRAAEQLGIAHETARSHMKAVMAKTGTHRQSEFVALVAPALSKVISPR